MMRYQFGVPDQSGSLAAIGSWLQWDQVGLPWFLPSDFRAAQVNAQSVEALHVENVSFDDRNSVC